MQHPKTEKNFNVHALVQATGLGLLKQYTNIQQPVKVIGGFMKYASRMEAVKRFSIQTRYFGK